MGKQIVAPMPGKVIDILVKEGETCWSIRMC